MPLPPEPQTQTPPANAAPRLARPRLSAEELAAADRAREYWARRRTPLPAYVAYRADAAPAHAAGGPPQ